MILLLAFAFIAGVVTILSPCIFPLLPIVLSSNISGKESKTRPFGVTLGFITSFTLFTLFFTQLVRLFHFPPESLRLSAVFIVTIFGLGLLIPKFQYLLEKFFSIFNKVSLKNKGNDFWSGFIVGLSIGILWTPCVGPIMASVIALSLTGKVTFDSFLVTLFYASGTAIPMFFVVFFGPSVIKKIPGLAKKTILIQKFFGVVMILTALAIFLNLDRSFQAFVLTRFPNYASDLTKIEDNNFIKNKLNDFSSLGNLNLSQTSPEIITGGDWFNSRPLKISDLKGKVVLVDFWTYSCINCIRTLPYIKKWWSAYKDSGLVIIGVHTPEFEFEKDPKNVALAIKDFGISYPVVQDNNFDTWNAFNNHYWPAEYFIDKNGQIRYSHFGEGSYSENEDLIRTLLQETGNKKLPQKVSSPDYQIYASTPETYLGESRIERFASNENLILGASKYSSPKTLPEDNLAFEGNWTVSQEYSMAEKNSKLNFNFSAKDVYLVANPKKGFVGKIKILVDGKTVGFTEDNKEGVVNIDSDRLYHLLTLPNPGRHILTIEFLDNYVEVFSFTFG